MKSALLLGGAWLLLACSGGQTEQGLPDRVVADASSFCSSADAPPSGQHWVTSWKTAPGDALITHPIGGMTVRQAFAPHWDGELMRLRLSNRYSQLPLTLDSVHVSREAEPGSADVVPGSHCQLSFGGESRITIAPGESVLSDFVAYPVRAFERLSISFYAPEPTLQLTRHLNANEFLYISTPGDYAAQDSGASFFPMPEGYASNFLVIEALEVAAEQQVTTLVAVGDSITDGSGATITLQDSADDSMMATDQRYPNHLQQRLLDAGMPVTVANAGIGGNELLNDGWLPQFGRNLLSRLDVDVLAVTGASHVLLMIGTNDFGNPKAGQAPTPEEMIAGYIEVIERVQAAGLRLILGTIPPAEGTITEGLLGGSPIGVLHGTAAARAGRDAVNDWIRQQNLSDGIVDFEACLEDPERPGYLAPQYDSGDNLHPNPAGYAAMAQCVDLQLLRDTHTTH